MVAISQTERNAHGERTTPIDYGRVAMDLASTYLRYSEAISNAVCGIGFSKTPTQSQTDLTVADILRCTAAWSLYDLQRSNLWDTMYWKQFLGENTTADVVIDIMYSSNLSRWDMSFALACPCGSAVDSEIQMEVDVAEEFKRVDEVVSIHSDEYMGRKRFLILLSKEKYDDALMGQLLSIEYDLRTKHSDLPASFVYLPRLFESPDEVMPQTAKLIYERDYDVFVASPFMASWAERAFRYAAIRRFGI